MIPPIYFRGKKSLVLILTSKVGGVGGFSKVVATFNHVGGPLNLFMATTGGVWIIQSFRIWGYVLHVEDVSRVITNCDQHQWAIPSLFSIALKALPGETLPENCYPYLQTCSSKCCYSMLLSQYSFLSLSFLLTFFRLVCYCSMWLCFSQGTSQVFELL